MWSRKRVLGGKVARAECGFLPCPSLVVQPQASHLASLWPPVYSFKPWQVNKTNLLQKASGVPSETQHPQILLFFLSRNHWWNEKSVVCIMLSNVGIASSKGVCTFKLIKLNERFCSSTALATFQALTGQPHMASGYHIGLCRPRTFALESSFG